MSPPRRWKQSDISALREIVADGVDLEQASIILDRDIADVSKMASRFRLRIGATAKARDA